MHQCRKGHCWREGPQVFFSPVLSHDRWRNWGPKRRMTCWRSRGKLVAEPSSLSPILLSLLIWCCPVNTHGSLFIAFSFCSQVSPEVWAGKVGTTWSPSTAQPQASTRQSSPHGLTYSLCSVLTSSFFSVLWRISLFSLPRRCPGCFIHSWLVSQSWLLLTGWVLLH